MRSCLAAHRLSWSVSRHRGPLGLGRRDHWSGTGRKHGQRPLSRHRCDLQNHLRQISALDSAGSSGSWSARLRRHRLSDLEIWHRRWRDPWSRADVHDLQAPLRCQRPRGIALRGSLSCSGYPHPPAGQTGHLASSCLDWGFYWHRTAGHQFSRRQLNQELMGVGSVRYLHGFWLQQRREEESLTHQSSFLAPIESLPLGDRLHPAVLCAPLCSRDPLVWI